MDGATGEFAAAVVPRLRRGDGDPGAYRAFFTFPGQNEAKARVLEQLCVWLGEKGWDPELAETGYFQREASELFVLHHDTRSSNDLRVRLREESPSGEWRTELTLSDPRSSDGWMSVTVTNDKGRFVDVPRIAAYVLDVVDGFDGPAALTSDPVLVSSAGIDDLLEELCSEDREGLLFVAGTADDSVLFPAFQRRVKIWTRQVRGLSRVVVLDPHATAELMREVGPKHAVPAWTVRTFQPLVDPAVELDGRRHRILGIPALAQRHDADLARLLGRAARAHAATRTLPEGVLKVTRRLARLEAQAAVSELEGVSPATNEVIDLTGPAVTPPASSAREVAPDDRKSAEVPLGHADSGVEGGASVPDQAAAYLAQVELVRSVLGVDALEESVLRELAERARRGAHVEAAAARIGRQLEEQQARVDMLEDEVSYYREYAEEEEFERALVEEDRARLGDQARWLRSRLSELRDFDSAFGEVPESAYTRYPQSFEELLARVEELDEHGVVFCAAQRSAAELDDFDSLGKLVRAAWEALLVLCDYLRARRDGACESGLEGYLERTPSGFRTVPPKRFASTETSRTMDAYGAERIFNVPVEVDASGTAVMKAHFKLGRVGMVSPRMYLLDRCAVDGKVYVGYLGEHLTNTQTN